MKYIAREPGAEGGFDNPSYGTDINDQLDDDFLVDSDSLLPTTSSTPFTSFPPTVIEEIEMRTRQHEKSGLPESSYVEKTYFVGRKATTEEIETRLARFRKNSVTGLTDRRESNPRKHPLSEED